MLTTQIPDNKFAVETSMKVQDANTDLYNKLFKGAMSTLTGTPVQGQDPTMLQKVFSPNMLIPTTAG